MEKSQNTPAGISSIDEAVYQQAFTRLSQQAKTAASPGMHEDISARLADIKTFEEIAIIDAGGNSKNVQATLSKR